MPSSRSLAWLAGQPRIMILAMNHYRVYMDNGQPTVIDAPGAQGPNRSPDFPTVNLGPNVTDWVDLLLELFLPWVNRFPKAQVIVEMKVNGEMKAWVEPL